MNNEFPFKIAGMKEHNDRIDKEAQRQMEIKHHHELLAASHEANNIAQKALKKADDSNKIALKAQKGKWIPIVISALSAIGTIGAFIISIIALVHSFGA